MKPLSAQHAGAWEWIAYSGAGLIIYPARTVLHIVAGGWLVSWGGLLVGDIDHCVGNLVI